MNFLIAQKLVLRLQHTKEDNCIWKNPQKYKIEHDPSIEAGNTSYFQ